MEDIYAVYAWKISMLFWAGIVRHSLSANQIVRCFKLKKLKKDMRYHIDFFLPLKLEEICYFGLWSQNTLGPSVCRIFYFWLVWLVKLNTGGTLLHCTCFNIIFLFIKKGFLMHTSYLAICLDIHVGICHMPTRIGRVVG